MIAAVVGAFVAAAGCSTMTASTPTVLEGQCGGANAGLDNSCTV